MEFLSHLNELIFPSRCISCGVIGISLCSQCRRGWNLHRYFTTIRHENQRELKVVSSVAYSQIAQKILLAAKESHIKKADLLLGEAIEHSIKYILRDEFVDCLIPIPSRASATRTRGRQFVEAIIEMPSQNLSIPIAPVLSHQRKVRDQSGLSHDQRWNNLHGAFVVRHEQRAGGKALLIDDLVTTGATLNEAAHALRYAGIEVIGAVTAAVALTTKIHR
jgi:predicted amidophosphoribosyltransferase